MNLHVLGIGILLVALVGLASGFIGAFLLPALALGALVAAREWTPGGALGPSAPHSSDNGSLERPAGPASQLFEQLGTGAQAAAEHVGAGALFGAIPGYHLGVIALQFGDFRTAGTGISFLLLGEVFMSAIGAGLHAVYRGLRDWSLWPLLAVAGWPLGLLLTLGPVGLAMADAGWIARPAVLMGLAVVLAGSLYGLYRLWT